MSWYGTSWRIPANWSWTAPGIVSSRALTTASLGDKSQCLQGKPPCVALYITQPSNFNTISWLPIADNNKIKAKSFPGLTGSSLCHLPSSLKTANGQMHTLIQTHHTLLQTGWITFDVHLPRLHKGYSRTRFHLPFTGTILPDKLDAVSSQRSGDGRGLRVWNDRALTSPSVRKRRFPGGPAKRELQPWGAHSAAQPGRWVASPSGGAACDLHTHSAPRKDDFTRLNSSPTGVCPLLEGTVPVRNLRSVQIPLKVPKPRGSGATIIVQSVTLLWEVPSETAKAYSGFSSDRINLSPFTKDFRGEEQFWVFTQFFEASFLTRLHFLRLKIRIHQLSQFMKKILVLSICVRSTAFCVFFVACFTYIILY